jgi:hypothetical protein
MSATIDLKALADKVIERNRLRNSGATDELRCPDFGAMDNPQMLRTSCAVAGAELRAVMPHVETACHGVPGITPSQFEQLLDDADRADIRAGRLTAEDLRPYACSFADGICTGRILFDPDTGALLAHGIRDPDVAA